MSKPRLSRIIHLQLIILAMIVSVLALAFGTESLPRPIVLFIAAALASSMFSFLVIVLYFNRIDGSLYDEFSEEQFVSVKQFARRIWWIAVAVTPLLYAFLLVRE